MVDSNFGALQRQQNLEAFDFDLQSQKKRKRFPSWATPFRVIATLVVGGGAVYAYSYSRGTKASYRISYANVGTAQQLLASSGTISPSSLSTIDFAVAGTVASVSVTVGQSVQAGQTLATLDSSSLNATLQAANSSLALAQLKLANDIASQNTTTTTTSTTVISTGPSPVLQTQNTLNIAESNLSLALSLVSSLCNSSTSTTATSSTSTTVLSPSAATTTTSTTTPATVTFHRHGHRRSPVPTTSSTTTTTTTTIATKNQPLMGGQSSSSSATSPTTCASALSSAGNDLSQVTSLTSQLTKAISASTVPKAATSNQGQSNTNNRGQSFSSNPATPTQVAVDEAKVSLAQANVADATAQLSLATLTSPIAGTVASIGVGIDSSVRAASSSSEFVIIGGSNDYTATFSASPSQLPMIHLGSKATVTPDMTMVPVAGTVTAIGAANTSASATTYPVTITFAANNLNHLSGGQASITMDLASAAHVLTVPTSAVTTNGLLHYVKVLKGSSIKNVTVEIGVVGSIYTQILSGLTPGEPVVLANNSLAIPATSTLTTRFGALRALGGGRALGGRGLGGRGLGGAKAARNSAG
ncbi:efflux RND transporter periplasmic adaptor subunit [Acidithrix ferrooxidans]|uniref:Putative efflux system component YknX n=1 Tax=Acidithrix ferrooxidans TaxID=1280514 RepID=A0A0D8HD84_9ACTN|nr:efflux RND transporter periplasmic adaptor subunit [Acidithrix ferrooxidans]KJF15839.1 putative efflux system component YknX [Acidithrix ferrooxidans]